VQHLGCFFDAALCISHFSCILSSEVGTKLSHILQKFCTLDHKCCSVFFLPPVKNLFLFVACVYLLLHILLFQKRTVMWLRMRGLCSLASQASRQTRLVFCPPESSLASFFTTSCSSSSSTRDESTPVKSYGEQRLDSLAGQELYPHKFRVTARVEDILQTYSYLSPGQEAVRN